MSPVLSIVISQEQLLETNDIYSITNTRLNLIYKKQKQTYVHLDQLLHNSWCSLYPFDIIRIGDKLAKVLLK